ncbi:MAG: extracellular solute-binding protein [Chloroflexi bacterium]|nr:extracellular solute-binding protein [Chloroflexota bacterium]
MRKFIWILVIALLAVALVPSTGNQSAEPVQAQDAVTIRWYVGLGAGTDAPVIEAQEAIVAEFNDSQDDIELVLEIVDNDQAYAVLSTQIAAGNAPDIVGPMGIRGRASFPGAWLDLTDLIEANNYDLTDFDASLVEFYRIEGEGQLGIPFAVFPSFMMYNTRLFDEAGIPYPPSAYGELYVDWDGNEREWNIETLRELAMILTVDENGNDATMEGFDPNNIIQFGYGNQFTDVRGRDTLFGSGNFADEEGNAVVPEHWREAEQWYHTAMWEDYFYPNGVYGNSELLGGPGGNWFGTGNIGMVTIHLWFMGWGTADIGDEWDFAPVPSNDGVTTAKLHADTFGIMQSSEHPEEAFTVLTYLLGEKADELTTLYGGMPARLSLQDGYFDRLVATQGETYPDVNWADKNWQIVVDGLSYPDNPNHEEAMPSFLEATDRYVEYTQEVDNNADADIDAALDTLQADLQAIFEAAN